MTSSTRKTTMTKPAVKLTSHIPDIPHVPMFDENDRAQKTPTQANAHQLTAALSEGGSGGAGKPPAYDWVELLDPGQPYYGNRCIEGMYRMLFNNSYLRRAYYAPRLIPGLAHAAEGDDPEAMAKALPMIEPMALTVTSARQAAHFGLVKPHERALVYLAAIVSPCGLLMATFDADSPGQSATPSWDEIAFIRMYMLSRPLIKIKAVDVAMGNTLAAVLGQSYEQGDVDFDQVTRLATAVRLSDTQLASYWSGQITAAPRQGRPH